MYVEVYLLCVVLILCFVVGIEKRQRHEAALAAQGVKKKVCKIVCI